MKSMKALIIFLVGVSICFRINAQDDLILRGRIIDKTDGMAVIGANVVEYDGENRIINGTITNVNGDFVIRLKDPSNAVKVSVIGYESKQLVVDFTKTIVLELEPTITELEEVTIVAESKSAHGLTNITDRDKATSSVKVDLVDAQDAGVISAADALQGKVSGLDIISASGDPGSGSQLVIRGLSSMGNNRPLIVIDGIPQFRVGESFDLTSADAEDISNLINIAVQDIKSIEVLKDAASAAIYGSRGADGVLIIETKKGRMGKVQFDYQYKNSLNVQPPAIPMLNGDEYIMLQLEEWHNNSAVYEIPPEIAYDRNYENFYNYSANTDWLAEITQNGKTQDHYFSLSGGGEKTRFFTSIGYLDEGGTTINTRYRRFSSRTSLDYFLSRKLLFQIKFNYTNNKRESNIEFRADLDGDGESEDINVREMAYIKAPNMSIWEYDEFGNPTGEYFNPIYSYQGSGLIYFNPVAVATLGRRDRNSNGLENTYMIEYRITDWLIFRETMSFQFSGSKSINFTPYNAIGADWLQNNNNRANEGNNQNNTIRTETQLSFNVPFRNQNHELSGAISWVTDQSENEWINFQSRNGPSIDIQDPAINAHVNWIGNGSGESRMLSGVSNINYKFQDKYLIQTNLRADAHSSFGEDNRWGLFTGIAVGWRFSSEPFFETWKFLGESKLKFSWGVSGRQPRDAYARFATYESTGSGSYILNPSIAPRSIQLSNLRWETITSYDVGLELNLFADRLFIAGDIYEKVTSDILFERYQIPNLSGYEELRYFNEGELTNHGWELMTDIRPLRTRNWLVAVNFNISQNINSFSRLPENFNPERSTSLGNEQYPQRIEEGAPIGSFFGFRYLGVFPTDQDAAARDAEGNIMYDSDGFPIYLRFLDTYTFRGGDPIYQDVNYDGRIDLNDIVYLGSSSPKFIGGFGARIKYKNINLSANLHYRLGFEIINSIAMQTEGMNDRNNQSKAVLRRWRYQGEAEEGILPRAYMNHPANNLGSDRYVEKGDYLRLNSLKISYQLREDVVRKLRLRKVNLAFDARKIYTWTKYTGQDPEVGQDASDPFWIGVDEARTPPPMTFTFTIGIGF